MVDRAIRVSTINLVLMTIDPLTELFTIFRWILFMLWIISIASSKINVNLVEYIGIKFPSLFYFYFLNSPRSNPSQCSHHTPHPLTPPKEKKSLLNNLCEVLVPYIPENYLIIHIVQIYRVSQTFSI